MGRAARLGAPLVWLGVIVAARAGLPPPAWGERWIEPFTELLASLVQLGLGWAGIDTLRHGAMLYAPGAFAYEIAAGCTGVLPAAVVVAAILASPGTPARKRWGLAAGVTLVLLVNVVRLAHLFYLGLRSPEAFEQAHRFWWEGVLVATAVAAWLAWSAWEARATRAGSAGLRDQAVE